MLEWPTEDERLDYVDWQDEVSNGDTALGFRDWLTHQVVTETDPRDHPYSGAITYASNCTEGLMCPSCGSADRFVVEGRTAAVLIDDGTDEYGYFDFGDEDTITCSGCGHKATVRSFTLPPGPNWRSYGDGLLSAALPSPHHEGHAVVRPRTATGRAPRMSGGLSRCRRGAIAARPLRLGSPATWRRPRPMLSPRGEPTPPLTSRIRPLALSVAGDSVGTVGTTRTLPTPAGAWAGTGTPC